MIEPGSYAAAFGGGAIIGLAAVSMMALNGKIMGVSGIAAGIFAPGVSDRVARVMFIAGMILGGVILGQALPSGLPGAITSNVPLLIFAGLAVGLGTRLGGGCTSGHGVCGMSRLSTRSFVATAIFMAIAMVTVFVTRHMLGVFA